MARRAVGGAITAVGIAILSQVAQSVPASAGDAVVGAQVFEKCTACHRLDRNNVGPALKGVVGRRAGSAPGYSYTKDLKEAGFTWTTERLDEWLSNPRKMMRGTKMTFPGLPKAKDRENVIEFLKQSAK